MSKIRLLLVDDNDDIPNVFQEGLEGKGFEVFTALSVVEALHFIAPETVDVLLSDLHMPDAGDGFTVVSAMRKTHPKAVILVLSGYPALQEAMSAILFQADEVLTKSVGINDIAEIIQRKLATPSVEPAMKENVADILEREAGSTIPATDGPRGSQSRVERTSPDLRGAHRTPSEGTPRPCLLVCRLRRHEGASPMVSVGSPWGTTSPTRLRGSCGGREIPHPIG
jgi:CheY-like chemotaxis protein